MTHIAANAASGEVSFTMSQAQDVNHVFDAIDDLGYHVVRADQVHRPHHHGDQEENWRLLIAALLTMPLLAHMFLVLPVLHNPWVQLVLSTPVFVIGCIAFLPNAYRSLRSGLPNMDVLIILGATAAYVYSLIGVLTNPVQARHYLFFETTASIITLVLFGNWLEHRTVRATTVAIDDLVKLQPQTARVVMVDSIGKESVIDVESKYVRSGDLVIVNEGDRIPVDGVIVRGNGQVDERMITGESLPTDKAAGANVVGGTLLLEGALRVEARNVGKGSVLSGIIRMVREAQASKPPLQKLADKISAVFVPAVLGIAVLTFLINYFLIAHSVPQSLMRSIAVLVISCPCAMGLATPAAIAVGVGRAARNGILIKGGQTLELLKTIRQIVFDKTGTLTTGDLNIGEFVICGLTERAFKNIVASLESYSSHPIARAVVKIWAGYEPVSFREVREIKGKGMEAIDERGVVWRLGAEDWLAELEKAPAGFDVYLVEGDQFRGALNLADDLRPDAADTIAALHHMGFRTALLSGDKAQKCQATARQLGIHEVHSHQTPEQKLAVIASLKRIAPTAMVGDGINDAPALAHATIGISLSDSSNIAIQSADVILSGNKLSLLPKAIVLGIYTERTIRQNLFWAFIYNVVAIPVAAAGFLSPTWGALIMAMSDVVLILNSLRLNVRRLTD